MNKENKRELKINNILVIMGVVCSILAIAIIVLLSLNKAKIETLANSSKQMEHNYTTTTESNTWDISKNGDGSVIAKLDESGLLTIAGRGEMKAWSSYIYVPWYSVRNQIKNVKIENGVTSIDSYTYYNCISLTNIEIPESVTSIGTSAFYSCTSLTNIEVDENNEKYCDENGILYTKGKKEIISYPAGKTETKYTIINGVTSIERNAFLGCKSLTSIEIPVSVTSIGNYAFSGCTSLTSIELPENVTDIGEGVFKECSGLTSIEIPSGVRRIAYSAFQKCTNLTSIEIPKSVTNIGTYAFESCKSLTSIEIPESVTSIGDSVFSGCTSLTSIEVDVNNKKYCDENGVLYTKDKKEIIKYPAGKKETKYTIINGVTSIGDEAFENCSSLTSIEIPNSVTSIGSKAFSNCTNLTIICKSGSTAETYAKENAIKYQTDDIGPEIQSTLAANTNPSKKIEVKINVTDEVAGVDEQSIKYLWSEENQNITKDQIIKVCANGETLQLKDVTGTYYLWIYAIDQVGNETIEKKGPFKLDNTAPTANINYSTTTVTNQNVTVTITANETVQEVEGWILSSNGQDLTKEYTSNTVVEGENITIKDLAGNESTVNVKILNIDKERPTINISYSTTNVTNQNVIVTIKGNEELQGITEWTKSSNGKELTKEYTSNTVVEGENIIIKDLAGNESTVNVKVLNIDKERPTINISYSTTNVTNQNVIVTIKANEELQGITGWTKSSNGKELTKEYTSNTVEEGENITIKDLAGNESTVNVKVLNIDKELPTLEISTEITSTTISVTTVAKDSNSGINESTYKYYIKEENGTYGEGSADGNAHTFTNLKTEQKYYIKVEVTDNAGNKASKEVQVIIKKSNKVTSTEYKINEEKLMIKEIQPKTTVGEIKNKIQGEMEFKIINAKGETVSDTAKVATGYKIKLEDNKEYTLVVTGDSNGDGETNIKDILSINKHRLNKAQLRNEYLEAGDVNGDGKADIKDILQINKFRLGKISVL